MANWISTILARLTAARAGNLDQIDFDLDARLGNPAGASVSADIATVDGNVDNIASDSQIRVVASGAKTIAGAATKYLSIDSGTNGAEILAIVIKGVVGDDWTVDLYVPAADGVSDTAAEDKRDSIVYETAQTEGGLLPAFAIPFNAFLDFTNDGVDEDSITQVQIVYHSRAALTLAWEA